MLNTNKIERLVKKPVAPNELFALKIFGSGIKLEQHFKYLSFYCPALNRCIDLNCGSKYTLCLCHRLI